MVNLNIRVVNKYISFSLRCTLMLNVEVPHVSKTIRVKVNFIAVKKDKNKNSPGPNFLLSRQKKNLAEKSN